MEGQSLPLRRKTSVVPRNLPLDGPAFLPATRHTRRSLGVAPVNFWIEQGDSHPANGARDFVGFRCAKSWAAAEEGRIRERAISKSCKDDESRSKPPFARWLGERRPPYAILIRMQSPLKAPSASTDPKSVQENLTAGTGMEIEWRDGHRSSYSF